MGHIRGFGTYINTYTHMYIGAFFLYLEILLDLIKTLKLAGLKGVFLDHPIPYNVGHL